MNKVVTSGLPFLLIGPLWQPAAFGQEQPAQAQEAGDGQVLEEVVAVGRFLSASEQVAAERLNDAAVVDTLGADSISRLGDSTVAAALRRVPGLSLVGDKFVYVRGLGERYSATTLNGAQIPSPDLTRNVIPLDVFPTSVVDSLRVQKAWAPDVWANFGGGSVDVRTRGIPPAFTYNLEVGTGYSSATPSSVNTYPGGGDDNIGADDGTRALASSVAAALYRYRGDLSPENIMLRDPSLTPAEARAINQDLALELYRNIGIERKSAPIDTDLKGSIGTTIDVSDRLELGVLGSATYQNHWRGTTANTHNFRPEFYDEWTGTRQDSLQSVDISGNVNVGARYLEDHNLSFTSLYLRNTDDRTTINDFHNENGTVSEGVGFRDYELRYEERNLRTNQLQGSHYLGAATRARYPWLGRLLRSVPEDTLIEWFSSESKAATDIPNEVTINARTLTDPGTGEVLSERVDAQSDAGTFRFTRLDDTVNSAGWSIVWPIEMDRSRIEFKAGSAHSEKARTYRQTDLVLGPQAGTPTDVLQGSLDQVYSDSNIADYNFSFTSSQDNARSYLAATMTDAVFGMVDWTIRDTWRIVAGSRWEDYRQAALAWKPYGFPQVTTDAGELEQAKFQTDKAYPALSLTYMGSWWAETFQLRFGASTTAVRPDLREIMDASYLDPITGDLTYGNPGVVPAEVSNLDIRAEWFFANGDTFSATVFSKDIDNPIEFYERGGDTSIVRGIGNAESATVSGVEFEWLKRLGFIGRSFEPFFLQGNLTLQDSNLVAGAGVNAAIRRERKMVGASDYVANFMLGYDSRSGNHTVSLIYNVFGERLYVPGDLPGHPDALEQPFHSLDLTYSWYATDKLTVKAKAQNILSEKIEIQRLGVTTYELDPGSNLSVSAQWGF